MIDLSKFSLKVETQKPKCAPKIRRPNKKITKLVTGKVIFKDNRFRCFIKANDYNGRGVKGINIVAKQALTLEFTEETYDLHHKKVIFTRKPIDGRTVCIIRDYTRMLTYPGDRNRFLPFAVDWLVRGWIVEIDEQLMFKFRNCITIDGHDYNIKKLIDDEEFTWTKNKMKQ